MEFATVSLFISIVVIAVFFVLLLFIAMDTSSISKALKEQNSLLEKIILQNENKDK